MIFGVGIDLAEIARCRRAYERFGERFAARILSPGELAEFPRARDPARFLAMRFAAKEAASKALGTGFRQGVAPRQFSVVHAASGKPDLHASGAAARWFDHHGIVMCHVSLSDEGGIAAAVVILECAVPPQPPIDRI